MPISSSQLVKVEALNENEDDGERLTVKINPLSLGDLVAVRTEADILIENRARSIEDEKTRENLKRTQQTTN